jgi:hypothetical protein
MLRLSRLVCGFHKLGVNDKQGGRGRDTERAPAHPKVSPAVDTDLTVHCDVLRCRVGEAGVERD